MELDNFYILEYSEYWSHLHFYSHNLSADMSFSLLQVFHGAPWNLHKTLNWTLYLIPDGTIYQPLKSGQDMTQSQFFKRSLTGLNSEFSFS